MRSRIIPLLSAILIAFSLFSASPCHGENPSDPELDKLKSVYKTSLAKLDHAKKTSEKSAKSTYGRKINAAAKHFKNKGDLDNYKAMLDESKRFKLSSKVPASGAVKNSHIKKAAMEYEAAAEVTKNKFNESHAALLRKYQPTLEKMVMKRVQGDDLEGATRAKEELEKIKFVSANLITTITANKPKRQPKKSSKPKPKQETVVKRISMSGSGMTIGQWRKQSFKITKGSKVTVSVKPGMSFDKVSSSYKSIVVRLGETGPQMRFCTDGSYYRTYSGSSSSSSAGPAVVASEDCNLYVQQNQKNRMTITVTIDPPGE